MQEDGQENIKKVDNTVCPISSDPFYIVTYYIEWVTTSWTYCITKLQSYNARRLDNIYKLYR